MRPHIRGNTNYKWTLQTCSPNKVDWTFNIEILGRVQHCIAITQDRENQENNWENIQGVKIFQEKIGKIIYSYEIWNVMNSFDFSNKDNLTNRRKNTTNLYKNMNVSKALGALHIGPALPKVLELL